MAPRVTVVILTYRSGRVIDSCLVALATTTYRPLCVVVKNGSKMRVNTSGDMPEPLSWTVRRI